jgi:hypothetical protein
MRPESGASEFKHTFEIGKSRKIEIINPFRVSRGSRDFAPERPAICPAALVSLPTTRHGGRADGM